MDFLFHRELNFVIFSGFDVVIDLKVLRVFLIYLGSEHRRGISYIICRMSFVSVRPCIFQTKGPFLLKINLTYGFLIIFVKFILN